MFKFVLVWSDSCNTKEKDKLSADKWRYQGSLDMPGREEKIFWGVNTLAPHD